MKQKGISLLVGVLVLGGLGGAYVALKEYNQKTEEQAEIDAAGDAILEVDATTVTGLSFLIGEEEVSFTMQEDGTWNLDSDETFPVDSDALLTPVTKLSPLYALRTLSDVEAISEYGLDAPQNRIMITLEDGEQITLTIGATNSTTGDDYLMVNEDEKTIYTVETSLRTAFSDDLYDYAVGEEIPWISASDICAVSVERETDSYRVYLEDALWKLEVDSVFDADSDAVNDALSSIAGLSFVDYLDHDCEDPETYGLDEPTAVLTITYKEEAEEETDFDAAEADGENTEEADSAADAGESETEESTVEETLVILVGSTDEKGNYYVQLEGSSEVHTIAASDLDEFLGAAGLDWEAEEVETEEVETESETEN